MRLRRQRKNARVEMLPLMDVVFLLLVFFIYSMLMMAVHRGTPMKLPSSETAERENVSVLALSVKSDGSIFLDKEPIGGLSALTEILKQKEAESQAKLSADATEAAKQSALPSLQIFAEHDLLYQDLYQVLDAVKAAGIRKISLQARQD